MLVAAAELRRSHRLLPGHARITRSDQWSHCATVRISGATGTDAFCRVPSQLGCDDLWPSGAMPHDLRCNRDHGSSMVYLTTVVDFRMTRRSRAAIE